VAEEDITPLSILARTAVPVMHTMIVRKHVVVADKTPTKWMSVQSSRCPNPELKEIMCGNKSNNQ
jgi:hypothetical protein